VLELRLVLRVMSNINSERMDFKEKDDSRLIRSILMIFMPVSSRYINFFEKIKRNI